MTDERSIQPEQYGQGRGRAKHPSNRDKVRAAEQGSLPRGRGRGRASGQGRSRGYRLPYHNEPRQLSLEVFRVQPEIQRAANYISPVGTVSTPSLEHNAQGIAASVSLPAPILEATLVTPGTFNAGNNASSVAVQPRQQSLQTESGSIRGYSHETSHRQQTVISIPGYRSQGNGTTFFAPGRVFEMITTDIAGWSERTSNSSRSMSVDSFGQSLISKRRALVSVHAEPNFCRAVPITSYGGQGVSKPSVIKSDHCIVYTTDVPPDRMPTEAPNMLQHEEPMQPYAIRIDPDLAAGWVLNNRSRLNLAAERTVEYYYRVKNLGRVSKASMPYLELQVRKVREQRDSRSKATSSLDFSVEEALAVLSRSALPMDDIREQIERMRT